MNDHGPHLDRWIEAQDGGYTDADIPRFKAMLAGRSAEGQPLIVHPNVAAAMVLKGFEEHTHFEISQKLPLGGATLDPMEQVRRLGISRIVRARTVPNSAKRAKAIKARKQAKASRKANR